ncbi:Maf family protein [Schinkia sp. CFF1]
MKKLILASSSPRRKELMSYLNIPFEIVVSHVEEHFNDKNDPSEIVQALALQKAEAVAESLDGNVIVIGADTIVTIDKQILGKPKDEEDARIMLTKLSGREHTVYTGVAIIAGPETRTFFEETKVEFWDLTAEEIDNYIKSGEPLDKAGAYGIQNLGSILVKRIEGDYYSVVGLPIARTYRELKNFLI